MTRLMQLIFIDSAHRWRVYDDDDDDKQRDDNDDDTNKHRDGNGDDIDYDDDSDYSDNDIDGKLLLPCFIFAKKNYPQEIKDGISIGGSSKKKGTKELEKRTSLRR